jgi:hypothetical protein
MSGAERKLTYYSRPVELPRALEVRAGQVVAGRASARRCGGKGTLRSPSAPRPLRQLPPWPNLRYGGVRLDWIGLVRSGDWDFAGRAALAPPYFFSGH